GRRVDYQALSQAPVVLLVGFEPEEESPIVYLRLRKATRKNGLRVVSLAPVAARGLERRAGALIQTPTCAEAEVLAAIGAETSPDAAELMGLLRSPGAVIMAGERLAGSPGALSAVLRLAEATGAELAWVPRRAGERGALEAGALP